MPHKSPLWSRNGHHNSMIDAVRAWRGPGARVGVEGEGGFASLAFGVVGCFEVGGGGAEVGSGGDVRRRAGVEMRDLRYKMIMALNAADLGDPLCEQVAEICAEIAEQHCAEFGHTPQVRTGEIAELATGDPALTWAPSTPDAGQRAW